MFTFHRHYFILLVVLFLVELAIALFVHDKLIRPYIGDLLVIVLLYCLLKSFLNITITKAAFAVLLFAYLIEFFQYIHLVKYLKLENSSLAKIVLGSTFEWVDMVVYTIGFGTIISAEFFFKRKQVV